jgi:hypothetical protein
MQNRMAGPYMSRCEGSINAGTRVEAVLEIPRKGPNRREPGCLMDEGAHFPGKKEVAATQNGYRRIRDVAEAATRGRRAKFLSARRDREGILFRAVKFFQLPLQ